MVIVVPALTEGDEGHERRVATRVGRGVAAPAHHVRKRVHGERGVPQQHGREQEAEHQATPATDVPAEDSERPGRDGSRACSASAARGTWRSP